MTYKWMGAVMVILGCGGTGISMALEYRQQESQLAGLIRALGYMECMLAFRGVPLPELCRKGSGQASGLVSRILGELARRLETSQWENVESCMEAILKEYRLPPGELRELLEHLGSTLGQFDLQGQCTGLQEIREQCKNALADRKTHRDARIQSYETLGLCAGAALAILFV